MKTFQSEESIFAINYSLHFLNQPGTSEGNGNDSMSFCTILINSGALGLFVGLSGTFLDPLIMWMFPSTKKYLQGNSQS